MATIKKILGGYKARNNGEIFENALVRHSGASGVTALKIPSGCRWVKSKFGVMPKPMQTPFDFVLTRKSVAVFIDAKSVSSKSFTRSAIKPHQLLELLKKERDGFCAGYVVYFQEINSVIFFSAGLLSSLNRGKSLKPTDGKYMGTLQNLNVLCLFDLSIIVTKGKGE